MIYLYLTGTSYLNTAVILQYSGNARYLNLTLTCYLNKAAILQY